MKDPAYYHYGIYKVEVWMHRYQVMLKSKADGGTDDCLIMTDGRAWNRKLVYIGNCIEAAAIGDSRELWFYHTNMQLAPIRGNGKCLESVNGADIENNGISVL